MRWSGGRVWDCLLWRQLSAVQAASWLDGNNSPARPDGPAVMGASQAAIRAQLWRLRALALAWTGSRLVRRVAVVATCSTHANSGTGAISGRESTRLWAMVA